nr:putative transcriptional antiterminator [uncultured bacterium]
MIYYKILKVLNNSSLLVSDGINESIIIGSGIGFKRKPNEVLDETVLIEKEFHLLKDTDYKEQSRVPKNIIINTAEIVNVVNQQLDTEMSEHSTIALSNHIAAMLVRIEHDEIFANPFHHETVTLYPIAYKMAHKIGELVYDTIGVCLPESEIDFLTLYIHSIRSGYDRQNIAMRNAIISEVSEVLEDVLGYEIDKSSTFYSRFVTHIKFLIQRLTRKEPISSNPMIKEIASEYPDYIEMSKPIGSVISEHLQVTLSIEEEAYIAMHLMRLSINYKQESRE